VPDRARVALLSYRGPSPACELTSDPHRDVRRQRWTWSICEDALEETFLTPAREAAARVGRLPSG